MRFTYRQILHADAVARHRSFREAAAELFLTQPALTRSIKSLEASLGGQVFDRLSTGVEPTRLGEVFLAKARLLLLESDGLERDVDAILGLQQGLLSVATGPYPGEYLVPEAMARLVKEYPTLTYRLSEMDWRTISDAILARTVEIAIADIGIASADQRLEVELLIDDPLFYICRPGHPLANQRDVSFEDIHHYPLVSNSIPPKMNDFLSNPGPSGSIDHTTGRFEPRIEVTTFSATKRVVMSSDGVTLAPISQVESELNSGSLTVIRTEPVPLRMNSGFIYLTERTLSPMAVRFKEEVRRVKSHLDERSARFEASFFPR